MAESGQGESAFNGKMSFSTGNVSQQWKLFKRQLEFYLDSKFTANQLTNRKKTGVLMTALGREGIEIYDTLFEDAEEPPSYGEIIEAFDDFCNPRKNLVYERGVFFGMRQKPGQSADSFILALQKQARLCEFISGERDSLIRDILVLGIRDGQLREELFRDADLDLPGAIEAVKIRERSKFEASQIDASTSSSVAVNRIDASKDSKRRFSSDSKTQPCPNCTFNHGTARPCPAATGSCRKCGQKGHFIRVCPSRVPARAVKAVESQPDQEDSSSQVDLLKIYSCTGLSNVSETNEKAWFVNLPLGGSSFKFKLDTAAECNTLSQSSLEKLVPRPTLIPSSQMIKPYNAPAFRPLGKVRFNIRGQLLEFLVMPGDEENLLGFHACRSLGLIARVSVVKSCQSKESFVGTNRDLFQGMGKIPGLNKLYTDPAIVPRAVRPRRFAYVLVDPIIATLKEMAKQDIIVPVTEPTSWVSNMTIVEKADGTLRICLDPQALNKALQVPKYAIPKTDDILVQLTNKKLFTVIDLKSGFWHMELDEESSKLTTFNTPIGRYRFKRMCFGINCAPEMFMAEMVRIFGTIKDVHPYFDDLIIATNTADEHDTALDLVCKRAREFNIKFNLEKLQYKQSSVQFLGLVISDYGVKPAPKHIRAIQNMPKPTDKSAVLRFLGLIKFLARFLPNVSSLTANLRALTRKDAEFKWEAAHESEFNHLTALIIAEPVLAFFDSTKPVVIQTDSSKDGLGSVLLQEDRPVAFASRALTSAEVKYSQIEKELLAIVFAAERFHEFVYGIAVTVQSDHRPLEAILKKDLDHVSPRLQRLRLRLLKYNVNVVYKPGSQMLVADALSRAFLTDELPNLEYQSVNVHTVKSLAVSEEKAQWLAAETKNDQQLGRVLQWVETNSWPELLSDAPPCTRQYFSMKAELSSVDGLLFFNNRLVIPTTAQEFFADKLHEGHLSAEKMKRTARDTVYWPGMSRAIENRVRSCESCQKFARNNVREPLHPYPIATYPWQQLALDIASLGGKDYLIVVDKFSNWPAVFPLSSKSAPEVVSHLKCLFAVHGIPEVIVSDNNPCNSQAYMSFAAEWGFQPIFTSPHYSQANGHAERTVQTVKSLLRKCTDDGTSFQYALLQYRNTPIADTGFSPAQALMGRRLRTKLPVTPALLKPQSVPAEVVIANKEKSQAVQKYYYDRAAEELPPLQPTQPVWVKDDLSDKQWQPGVVKDLGEGPRSFVVEKEDGGTVVRNRRFLRPREAIETPARYR